MRQCPENLRENFENDFFEKNTENYYGWHMVIRKKRRFGAKNTFWGSTGANYVVFLRIFCFFDFFNVFGDIVYFVKIEHIIHGNWLNRREN